MNNFRCYDLALELHRKCNTIQTKGHIKDQMSRASLSIALNLNEAKGRIGKDRLHFFRIAYGSCREVQTCLEILESSFFPMADKLGGMIYRLIQNPGR